MKKMSQSRKDRIKKAYGLGQKDEQDSETGMKHEYEKKDDNSNIKKLRKKILSDLKK